MRGPSPDARKHEPPDLIGLGPTIRHVLLLAVVLAALGCMSSSAIGQGVTKVWRLSVLQLTDNPLLGKAALPELAKRGFVEGRNLLVENRIGSEDALPQLARELVGAKPDAIIAVSDWAVFAAQEATRSVPIVASPMGQDPVLAGIAESWARPGGNVTGVTVIAPELEVKRLALLREVVPSAQRIAMLSMHRSVTEPGEAPIRAAAANSGIRLVEFCVDGPDEFETAFSAMRSAGAEGLVIVPVPELQQYAERLAALAVEGRLPTVCGYFRAAEQGCLMRYGPDAAEVFRQAADYTARIFRGALPGELPIHGPTHYEFAVNLKTAKALGVTLSPAILARADEIIE